MIEKILHSVSKLRKKVNFLFQHLASLSKTMCMGIARFVKSLTLTTLPMPTHQVICLKSKETSGTEDSSMRQNLQRSFFKEEMGNLPTKMAKQRRKNTNIANA